MTSGSKVPYIIVCKSTFFTLKTLRFLGGRLIHELKKFSTLQIIFYSFSTCLNLFLTLDAFCSVTTSNQIIIIIKRGNNAQKTKCSQCQPKTAYKKFKYSRFGTSIFLLDLYTKLLKIRKIPEFFGGRLIHEVDLYTVI